MSKFILNYLLFKYKLCLKIQVSKIGNVYKNEVYDRPLSPDLILTEFAQGGVSRSKSESILKGIVEYIERLALLPGQNSTGFAAFPVLFSRDRALKRATKNAYFECVERWCVSKWLNNPDYSHKIGPVTRYNRDIEESIKEISNCKKVLIINIHTNNAIVIACIAVLENGYLWSSSAGPFESYVSTEFRGLTELMRNALAYRKYLKEKPKLTEDCQRDLINLARNGNKLTERISLKGTGIITVPPVFRTEEIEHVYKNDVVVVRVILRKQDRYKKDDLYA